MIYLVREVKGGKFKCKNADGMCRMSSRRSVQFVEANPATTEASQTRSSDSVVTTKLDFPETSSCGKIEFSRKFDFGRNRVSLNLNEAAPLAGSFQNPSKQRVLP